VVRVVDSSEYAALDEIGRQPRPDPLNDPVGFWEAAMRAASAVPSLLAPPLPGGLALLRGLPADRYLPDTPCDSRRPPGSHLFLSELWLSAFGVLLGTPIAYKDQQGASLHQNVAPILGSEQEESDVGSARTLRLHTENPFHVIAPDYVLLSCLRADAAKAASTTLASVTEVLARLDPRMRDALRRPIFVERGAATMSPAPVVSGPSHDPQARFDAAWTTSTITEGVAALEALARALPASTRSVNLVPGDLLMIDNRRWLHGRRAFATPTGVARRWLQRLYVGEESPSLKSAILQGILVSAPVPPSGGPTVEGVVGQFPATAER